jgi:hypothetical protein
MVTKLAVRPIARRPMLFKFLSVESLKRYYLSPLCDWLRRAGLEFRELSTVTYGL